MAPTIPYLRSPRGGQCSAITISSSGSDQITNTLIILSSATFSGSVVNVPDSSASRGGDEAGGAPPNRRPPSPAPPSAVPVRSPTIVTAASIANGSGHVGASWQTTAALHRCPSPCSVLSVRAPGGVRVTSAPRSSGGGDRDDEVTSRPKRKLRYRKWDVDDERKILSTLAELRRDNLGVRPQVSVLLEKIRADGGGLLRRGVDAMELSDKVYNLKRKFVRTLAKVGASGGSRRPRKYRDHLLYQISMDVWPELLGDVAAAVQVEPPSDATETSPPLSLIIV